MKKILLLTYVSLFTLCVMAQEKTAVTWKAYYKNGVRVESSDGQFALRWGGFVQADMAFFNYQDTMNTIYKDLKNGHEIRRMRLMSDGTLWGNTNYKLEFDFANGKAAVKDAYIEYTNIKGLGSVKVGHFKEAIRQDQINTDLFCVFIERSFSTAFANDRNIGIQVSNQFKDGRFTYTTGVFRNSNSTTANDTFANKNFAWTTRLTGLPLYNKEKNLIWHLGASHSLRITNGQSYSLKVKPESNLAPTMQSVKYTGVENVNLLNFETSFDKGPFFAQAEVINALVSSRNQGYKSLYSYYISAGYFITGETRNFKKSNATYDRLSPKKNVGKGGAGAWAVALRYSQADIFEAGGAGHIRDLNLGLNWYLNPQSRIYFNNIFNMNGAKGNGNISEVRFQVDF